MSNANATTEGTAPAPERLLPAGPSHWWRRGTMYPYVDEVCVDRAGTLYTPVCGSPVTDDGYWLAEVPPPDVCAAWAANWRPSAAVLEALGEYSDAVHACDAAPDEAELTSFLARSAADRALREAIRAERAAQGSAPVGQGVGDGR